MKQDESKIQIEGTEPNLNSQNDKYLQKSQIQTNATTFKVTPANKFLGYIVISVFFILLVFVLANGFSENNLQITVTVVGTNDIHGAYYQTLLARKDNKIKYSAGGLQTMATIIQILKKQNPNFFLYLDAGDQFQGGFQSSKSISSGQIMADYYNHMQLKASAVGNHQFDFGPAFLTAYLEKIKNRPISSNLVDQKFKLNQNGYLPLTNQQASRIISFPLFQYQYTLYNLKQIKIGVIGLSTLQTYYTTSGFTSNLFPGTYQFLSYKDLVISQSKKLKQQGADAIIILSHVGNQCGKNTTFGIWMQSNMSSIQSCNKTDEIFTLIDSIPEDTIHAVVQGHRHSINHHFYKNIPIIGVVNGGYYLNALHLKFSVVDNKFKVNFDELKIEGPIPVCEKIFQNTKKCQYMNDEELKNSGDLIDWNFHGKKVQKDQELAAFVKSKWGDLMKQYQIEIAQNFIPYPLQKLYTAENPLGSLITNLLTSNLQRKSYNFDFMILNSGGFRSTWYPGVIRYAQIFMMIPFDNFISFFSITGQNLKKSIVILQNGVKSFYPSWALDQKFKKNDSNKLQLVELLMGQQGSAIIDSKVYVGATINFLTDGGDDFRNIIGLFTNVIVTTVSQRQSLIEELKLSKYIDEGNLKNLPIKIVS